MPSLTQTIVTLTSMLAFHAITFVQTQAPTTPVLAITTGDLGTTIPATIPTTVPTTAATTPVPVTQSVQTSSVCTASADNCLVSTDVLFCTCDITVNSCDVNCCCDTDCDSQDLLVFTSRDEVSAGNDVEVTHCLPKSTFFLYNLESTSYSVCEKGENFCFKSSSSRDQDYLNRSPYLVKSRDVYDQYPIR